MGNYAIIDTGYLTATSTTGTQAPLIANSGTAITLKVTNIAFETGNNTDTTEIINSATGPVVNFGSVKASKITVQGVIDKNDATDVARIIELEKLRRTYGVKLFYYTSITDGYYDITDQLGDKNKNDAHKTTNFSSSAIPHIHVIVTNFQITQAETSHLRYTLEMVETE